MISSHLLQYSPTYSTRAARSHGKFRSERATCVAKVRDFCIAPPPVEEDALFRDVNVTSIGVQISPLGGRARGGSNSTAAVRPTPNWERSFENSERQIVPKCSLFVKVWRASFASVQSDRGRERNSQAATWSAFPAASRNRPATGPGKCGRTGRPGRRRPRKPCRRA
jgi:hypothetical protein